ncbi:TrkH family potassium uptake protein [Autumnicola edwardsiae]|uniref:TrkH family potassium uptake protein n=1 Tax=Autumnicola edwardsiae TaxID=3075594 RepID=A0ABU3CVB2_9FLAO|nr:TrkH family potassium uptake protein [Zunongwangia sp. F297]MDT0650299.1 TrkH family potassium uptake protein [Zunongwangia sp. F297]
MQVKMDFIISSEVRKTFFRDLGLLLHVPAFLVIPSLLVILYFEEYFALPSFLGMAFLSLAAGQILYRVFKNSRKSQPRITLIMVALAWFIIPLFGSIPFYFIGSMETGLVGNATNLSDFPSAFFESMSGFTSTGLSMLDHPETIPHSLQWLRSLSEWLGGMGIILLVVGFFNFSSEMNTLYQAEAMNWTIGDSKLEETIHRIWQIYLALTIVAIIAFYSAGMPGWEAINHGLTGISTGGFTMTPDSFISYNPSIKWVGIIVMIIAALSFQIHYLFFIKRDFRRIIRLSEFKVFSAIIIVLMVVVHILNPSEDVVNNVFQTASALGTCGFNSVETANMPLSILFLFVVAMTFGGNATSTTGGLKTRRIIWVFKGIVKNLPDSGKKEENKSSVYLNGKEIKDKVARKQIKSAANLFVLWTTSLIVGSFLIILSEGDKYLLHQILFDVSSALNNVGLSAGVNENEMTGFSKIVFICLMWIGRLEIFSCIVLIYSFFISGHFNKN